MDELTEARRSTNAPVDHLSEREPSDQVADVNVEIVRGQREAGDEPRLEDDAGSPGVGSFGLQARVAAKQRLILIRRVRCDVSELACSDASESALCGSEADAVRRTGR